ncbi:MAG: hypothetical protein ACLP0B_06345 [Steroidobacteraceae bacterium]|jgi:hypothetical protein
MESPLKLDSLEFNTLHFFRDASSRKFMIETIVAILFLLGIVLVATGPKSSDKKQKDDGASSAPTPKAPDSPDK